MLTLKDRSPSHFRAERILTLSPKPRGNRGLDLLSNSRSGEGAP